MHKYILIFSNVLKATTLFRIFREMFYGTTVLVLKTSQMFCTWKKKHYRQGNGSGKTFCPSTITFSRIICILLNINFSKVSFKTCRRKYVSFFKRWFCCIKKMQNIYQGIINRRYRKIVIVLESSVLLSFFQYFT